MVAEERKAGLDSPCEFPRTFSRCNLVVGEVVAGHMVDGSVLALLAHVARVGAVVLLVEVANLLLLHRSQGPAFLNLCRSQWRREGATGAGTACGV